MNPLQAFTVGIYATVALLFIALAAICPDTLSRVALVVCAALCLARAHYWYENA